MTVFDLDSEIAQIVSDLEDKEKDKYSIIYMDPPWKFDSSDCISDMSSAECIYPTMTVEEMELLPIDEISATDALIFMWVCSTHLIEALRIINSWGFEYRTIAFVWEKKRTNAGFYTQTSVEICLVAKKGRIPTPRGSRKERQFLCEKSTEHSKKPSEIRSRIERMFPTQRKIEIFSRDQVNGWTTWGNQSVCKDRKVSEIFEKHGFSDGLK
jgi:N6-adenosine-specific RNA methylase IME4